MSARQVNHCQVPKSTRRTFLKTAGTAAVTAAVGPTILRATDKAGSRKPILGTGAHQYEATSHNWGEVPAHIKWGNTHGVAIDAAGLVYIKHRSAAPEPMDAIAVFDAKGKFVRSFGKVFHGGGHGIDIRRDGKQEFLYLSDTKHGLVAKMTLKGELVWAMSAPRESHVYQDHRNRYRPTNLAFGANGTFYVGDGYGSNYVHEYDRNARWVRTWGGTGAAAGKMKTPHSIWLDDRPGREPSLVVADRANHRLQYFTLDGKHLGFINDEQSFPADFDLRGDVMMVADLFARVTLYGKDNKVITHLGHDPEWTKTVLDGFKVRKNPKLWQAGRFVHPHDACFDKDGNIFVTEWVPTGRISFLRHVS